MPPAWRKKERDKEIVFVALVVLLCLGLNACLRGTFAVSVIAVGFFRESGVRVPVSGGAQSSQWEFEKSRMTQCLSGYEPYSCNQFNWDCRSCPHRAELASFRVAGSEPWDLVWHAPESVNPEIHWAQVAVNRSKVGLEGNAKLGMLVRLWGLGSCFCGLGFSGSWVSDLLGCSGSSGCPKGQGFLGFEVLSSLPIGGLEEPQSLLPVPSPQDLVTSIGCPNKVRKPRRTKS